MTPLRWYILFVGPLPICILAFLITRWAGDEPSFASSNEVFIDSSFLEQARIGESVSLVPVDDDQIREQCLEQARRIKSRLGNECNVIVESPFVIAGDLSDDQLKSWYRRTIQPAAVAMWESYFDTKPDMPITVLLFSSKDSYDEYADQLFDDRSISVYGYYKPSIRTLIMNISTGGGTLVHELTHALIDFDFDRVPDWFNEGLASLHEQCRFRSDGDRKWIEGLENWRLPALQDAIREDRLPALRDMVEGRDFRGANVGLNYAQARYFCMFMQKHERLDDFYHEFRQNHREDPTGVQAVESVVVDTDWAQLDRAFQDWVLTLEYSR